MRSSYSIQLVLLSYIVAVLASHVTLSLAQRLRPMESTRDARGPPYWPWIVGGAFSMGTGIWSMHFIGMLAFHLPIQVVYDLRLTATSYVIGVGVSCFALYRFHRNEMTVRGMALPGVFIGFGIAAMHYTGMAAMPMFPAIYYDPLLFATSVLIAIGASVAALWIAFSLSQVQRGKSWHKLVAASVMGTAIVGMHYTGMAAAHFAPNAVCISSGPRLDATWLAITISAFTFLILGSTLLLSVIDARLQSTIARSAEALRMANEELEQRVLDRTAQLELTNGALQAEIAARQEMEQRLRNSHEQTRAIFETALDGIITMDQEGRITEFNPAAQRIFGLRREDVLGQPLADVIIPPAARALHRRGLAHYMASGEASVLGKRIELEGLRADGTCVPVELSINRMPGGGPMLFAGFLRDITERKHAQEKLRAQLDRLDLLNRITRAAGQRQDLRSIFQVIIRSLEESLPIDFGCICQFDANAGTLNVTSVGARGRTLAMELSLTEQAPIDTDETGMSRCMRGQLIYEPDITQAKSPFPQRLAHGGLRSFVAAPLLVEGKVFGVLIAARRETHGFSSDEREFLKQLSDHAALVSHQAQLYGALQQAYDELRQTTRTVLQQERMRVLGQMASGIAHDINNALSPVGLYAEALLESEAGLSERGRGYLATILRAIEDVAETVSRMKDFCRPRELQIALSRIEINRLVKQVVDLTRARWSDQSQHRGIMIELETELAAGLPEISGAEGEVRDALTNLIFNAVDAMPAGGTLTVRTKILNGEPAEGRVESRSCVEVCDTGVGMNEETRRHCLEPFFTTKGERGTGLGLSMVYGMVQRHNAVLEIESELGKGTTVRLVFPRARGATAETARPPESQALTRRLRILVIDDDPLVMESLRDSLRGDGHFVTTADGGRAGIDAFVAAEERGEPFSIVITDLGMPHVDGRKVAASIRAASPNTPIVLLTGWGQRLASEHGMPPEVNRLLSKPPKLRELRAALAELTQSVSLS